MNVNMKKMIRMMIEQFSQIEASSGKSSTFPC